MIGFALLFDKKEAQTERLTQNGNEDDVNEEESLINQSKDDDNETNSLGVNFHNPHEGMSLKLALRTPVFYMITAILSLTTVGPSLIVTFYKTFGQTFINSDKFLATIGSISNIFNAFGRLFWGVLVDKLPFKVFFFNL